ncbi:hypothetical protein KGP36_06755 [Patescibacteria group bacterium]|nr:hypothetical protein [Patescibacteria group bacterium]
MSGENDNFQPMRRIDDQQLGQLMAKVEILIENQRTMQTKMEEMQGKLNTGRGWLIGVVMAAGALGAGTGHLIQRGLEAMVK